MSPRGLVGASARASIELVWARLRRRTVVVGLVLSVAVLMLMATAIRAVAENAPLGRALGFWGDLWLTGLAFFVVRAVAAPQGLHRSFRSLAGIGLPRLWVSLAGIGAAFGVVALVAGLAFLPVVLLFSTGRQNIAAELLVGMPLCLVASAAYAFAFSAASSFGSRGGGQWLCLAAMMTLGRGDGWVSVLLPNPHVRSLLGGPSVVGMSQRASFLMLVVLAILALLLVIRVTIKRQGGRLT